MPELPEVETIVRRLGTVLSGKEIVAVTVFRDSSSEGEVAQLENKTIVSVSRKAKLIHISLHDQTSVLTHLKMTGQLIFVDSTNRLGGGHPTADWIQELPSKHTRVQIKLSGGATLFFNDQRTFGWMRHVAQPALEREFSKYAPDVIDDVVSEEYFWENVRRTNRTIKTVLLDPSIMSGLGNIYVCDALNMAQISPFRSASSLSRADSDRVLAAAKRVLLTGIELGGATIDQFRHVDGFSGQYQSKVLVYGRAGEPCKQCGATIVKEKIAGRGTYFCPECQI